MVKKTVAKHTMTHLLSKGGRRITRQRTLLLDLLHDAGGHVDADELYRMARLKQPRLSLSTVYRTLQMLKRMGLVEEHQFSEGHHHYEVKPRQDHQHLECLNCGRIVEFESALTGKLKEAVAREHGFTITRLEMHLAGLCPDCLRKGVKEKHVKASRPG